jgi:phosphatidylserine/phosphatidylglycerophosphate/cardiolipin synthase-like enzyme
MEAVARALRSGRLAPPFARSALSGLLPDEQIGAVQGALAELGAAGMAPAHVAALLELLAEERAAQQRQADRVELVLSPPELDHVDARDTAVVVQDLFRRATRSVLVVSYALDAGDKARALFGGLAARMDAAPELSVRLFVNVHRPHQDDTPAAELVRAFARQLRAGVWPGERLPEVFFDPRSVEQDGPQRAVLHAKCVVVDDRWTLLTSANFTEAAQERNIEAGVVLDDPPTAARVRRQLQALVDAGRLRRLHLPEPGAGARG